MVLTLDIKHPFLEKGNRELNRKRKNKIETFERLLVLFFEGRREDFKLSCKGRVVKNDQEKLGESYIYYALRDMTKKNGERTQISFTFVQTTFFSDKVIVERVSKEKDLAEEIVAVLKKEIRGVKLRRNQPKTFLRSKKDSLKVETLFSFS